ncbi:ADP-dependent NAD(P)H-hydrate dehydratase [Emydomyces testavorans]|uniref:ATP-dependent (S)-NAD(P)H-hydrate dehydratase n=1 Tax=Emydomyces testavorans TaxID=2070801 RepID=A0AAF0DH66_9EURO|nr:ADP-dependent NAD(P)H-hydrate dehydratase [Emydomyces testavorans]
MASAKLGCDMVIKSYSPNLMVHPLLHSTSSHPHPPHPNPHHHAEPIISFLPRIHALVIGPGLGRDPLTQSIVTEVMKAARTKNIPLVLDADALLLVQHQPELVRGYEECILTPNVVEFARLARAIGVDVSMQERAGGGGSGEEENGRRGEACERLARALGGVTIIQKGMHDVISNGATTVVSDVQGGKKRSGGQGDTLTGSLGTFLAWRKAYHEGLWEGSAEQRMAQSGKEIDAELHAEEDDDDASRTKERMSPKTTMLLVAWAGSAITRECSRRAFLAKGRSMQASDLTEEVHGAFLDLIGEPEGSKL